ncbi:aminoglycoside phosphotransferase family protein [Arthrobacter agilis]|uniref:aminoglycoside phosphotransferase family protein n=1 Tax=Arthrobacter agilis TaxID=37921 RepID=UPI0027899224|nr:aminoglycoside phosphotransferase family protein [Arthrobacter agilis]MDQ0734134.1 aminoglycoside phosphotransferase (APT) family kinase protein [Arthrobacter agilis]
MALMPQAEIDVAPSLVTALLAAQAPDLAHLPVRSVGGGWDNTLFRLGEDLVVRLPRRAVADALMVAEQRWLPGLAASVSVPTSAPLRLGRPGSGYPWHWSVSRWIDGVGGLTVPRDRRSAAAVPLARFLAAFQRPAPADAPVSPVGRGGPLVARDAVVRARLASLGDTPGMPGPQLLEVWEASLAAPAWTRAPLWLHGDLHPGNVVLGPDGALAGVVDFGDLCSGDPATDLAAAWLHFDAAGRSAFRAALEALRPTDAPTWTRARGWAVSMGSALAAASDDAPALHALGVGILGAVLEG